MSHERRIRVAFLAMEWPDARSSLGGVGRYVQRLATEIGAATELVVVAPAGAQRLDGPTFIEVPRWRQLGRFDRYYLMPLRAARAIRSIRPDVIHSHGDDFGLMWKTPAPIVRTYYGRSWSEAISGEGRPIRRINHLLLALIERITRGRFAAVVAIGPESVAAGHATCLIPPVFDIGRRTPIAARRDPRAVIFVGTFASKKRGWLALEVVSEVRESVPDLRFIVIGPNEDLGRYPSWVEFRSGLSDSEVSTLIASCGVLLAPSSYEGFGIPVWEALRHGTLALCTPNPGASFISNGPYCQVVASSELGAVLETLVSLDPARDAELRGRAVQRAQDLAQAGSPQRYLELYRDVASGHPW